MDSAPSNPRPTCPEPATDAPPNLLLDQPLPDQPDQVWARDITFIPTSSGWLYLAVVIDLCSRKIVGWALADNLRTPLVIDALISGILLTTECLITDLPEPEKGGGGHDHGMGGMGGMGGMM